MRLDEEVLDEADAIAREAEFRRRQEEVVLEAPWQPGCLSDTCAAFDGYFTTRSKQEGHPLAWLRAQGSTKKDIASWVRATKQTCLRGAAIVEDSPLRTADFAFPNPRLQAQASKAAREVFSKGVLVCGWGKGGKTAWLNALLTESSAELIEGAGLTGEVKPAYLTSNDTENFANKSVAVDQLSLRPVFLDDPQGLEGWSQPEWLLFGNLLAPGRKLKGRFSGSVALEGVPQAIGTNLSLAVLFGSRRPKGAFSSEQLYAIKEKFNIINLYEAPQSFPMSWYYKDTDGCSPPVLFRDKEVEQKCRLYLKLPDAGVLALEPRIRKVIAADSDAAQAGACPAVDLRDQLMKASTPERRIVKDVFGLAETPPAPGV